MDIVTTKVSMLNRFSSRRFKMQKEKIILRERECLIITELRENDIVGYYEIKKYWETLYSPYLYLSLIE